MSVWRIGNIDPQTRALADAAAKAAGLPLGVWLERAIMRRVGTKGSGNIDILPPAPPAEEISPEMQAALDAAERRRRQRGDGTAASPNGPATMAAANQKPDDELPADPFAAPEPAPVDAPFEAAEPDGASDTVSPAAAPSVETRPNASEEPQDRNATDAGPALEDATVFTTAREPLMPPPAAPASRRSAPSAITLLMIGLIVVVIGGAGAWYYFDRMQPADQAAADKPQTTAATTRPAEPAPTPTPTPAPTPAAAPPAAPPPPAPVPVQPATPPTAPAADNAAAPQPAPQPPTPPIAPPQPMGPSIATLAQPGAPSPSATIPPAATPTPAPEKPPAAAEPRADGTPPPPVADAALPALIGRAEAGEVAAQLELGRRYVQGVGVGRNEVEAAKWLTRAAEQGNGQAQFNVGVMYERGIGVTADLAKAIDFYRRSAAQNVPMAWHNLALLYAGGAPGLKADPAQARQHMIRAAELGQIESQYSLSLMYLQGVGGAADRVTAMSWLAVAARPNQPKLIEAAKQLSAQLSDGDRQRAQKLAEGHVRRISANLQRLQSPSTTAATSAGDDAPAKPRAVDKAAIMEMQKLMIGLKLYDGAADGLMGPRTGAAIRQFQEMAGLPVDGKPSIAVLESLREIAELSRQ